MGAMRATTGPGAGGQGSVLARKLRAARQAGSSDTAPAGRALRLAAARAGRRILGCDLMVSAVAEDRADRAEALEPLLNAQDLILVLEGGPEHGLVTLDPGAVAAIVALRTAGLDALETLEVPGRRPTAIEAALVRPLIDEFLGGWMAAAAPAALSSGPEDRVPRVCGPIVSGPRQAILGLPGVPFQTWVLDIDLAGSASGRIMLALPLMRPAVRAGSGLAAEDWQRQFRDAVLGCHTGLQAELHRTRIPLAQLRALRPGSVLPLPADCLSAVVLRPDGKDSVAAGRLGQMRGKRAIRLSESKAASRTPAEGAAAFGGALPAATTGARAGKEGARE